MPVLLLTGFEPFGGEKTNPSLEAIKKLSGYTLNDWKVETVELPVDWEKVAPPVCPHGPAAYFSTLPVDALASTLNGLGIPAYVSLSAGPYLCNFALYTLLHLIASQDLPTQATFMHIPYLPEQVAGKGKPDLPSMALDTVVAGLRVVVAEISRDISVKEGA